MDLTDLSNAMSKFTLSNDEENDENSAIVSSTKRTQFLATYRQQKFPFRASTMRYVAENPTSPEVYQKMIKTCKFFFLQNPIIVVSDLNNISFEWKNLSNLHWEPFGDLEKIMAKLWMTDNFHVCAQKDGDQNIISSIIPKFFQFEAKELQIANQIISLSDYVYLASSAEKVLLSNVTVKDENGSVLPVEKLVETATNAKTFSYRSDTVLVDITSDTFDELLKLPHFLQLDYFILNQIPESFDIEAFYIYMKKNKRTLFDLEFNAAISLNYKNRLEEIIDEILATENRDYYSPIIRFLGHNAFKSIQLIRLYHITGKKPGCF